jgi:hypothetical protein
LQQSASFSGSASTILASVQDDCFILWIGIATVHRTSEFPEIHILCYRAGLVCISFFHLYNANHCHIEVQVSVVWVWFWFDAAGKNKVESNWEHVE